MVCHLLAACWNFLLIFTMLQLDDFAIRGKTHYSYGQRWKEQGITPQKNINAFDLLNYSGGRPCQAAYGRKGRNDNIKICLEIFNFPARRQRAVKCKMALTSQQRGLCVLDKMTRCSASGPRDHRT